MKNFLLGELWVIVVLSLLFGCALSKTQKGVVLNLAVQNAGYVLAQENTGWAKDVLKYSKAVLAKEFSFTNWTDHVVGMIKLDPFLAMNFKEMMKLVNIQIELNQDQEEILKLTHGVVENFIIGIKAGLK